MGRVLTLTRPRSFVIPAREGGLIVLDSPPPEPIPVPVPVEVLYIPGVLAGSALTNVFARSRVIGVESLLRDEEGWEEGKVGVIGGVLSRT